MAEIKDLLFDVEELLRTKFAYTDDGMSCTEEVPTLAEQFNHCAYVYCSYEELMEVGDDMVLVKDFDHRYDDTNKSYVWKWQSELTWTCEKVFTDIIEDMIFQAFLYR